MPTSSVAEFFDEMNQDYTATIERCFPRYREMLCSLVDYLPRDRDFRSILEIGCGTGNLSMLLAQQFPTAELHCLDLSGESLDVCRERFGSNQQIHFQHQDICQADFPGGMFDLVVSSITIHHLRSPEKRELFQRCFQWLTPAGVFAYADQFRGSTPELYARHIDNWKQMSLTAGSTEDEFAMWMEHQREHDHHDTLTDQLEWLTQAGFIAPDCVWRCFLWCAVLAFKGAQGGNQ